MASYLVLALLKRVASSSKGKKQASQPPSRMGVVDDHTMDTIERTVESLAPLKSGTPTPDKETDKIDAENN